MKKVCMNVMTSDGDQPVNGLCLNDCTPVQLNAILNLCKPSYRVDIDFVEKDANINFDSGMAQN